MGYQHQPQAELSNKKTTYFLTAPLELYVLVVVAAEEHPNGILTGILVDLPEDIRQLLLRTVADNEKEEFKQRLFPKMLDTTRNSHGVFIAVASVGVLMIVILAWLLMRDLERLLRPELHPSVRKLSRFGACEQVGGLIDKDLDSSRKQKWNSSALLGEQFLLVRQRFGFEVISGEELVWVYLLRLDERKDGDMQRARTLNLCCKDADEVRVRGQENELVLLMQALEVKWPWIIAGYSKRNDDSWRSGPHSLISYVGDKRRRVLKLGPYSEREEQSVESPVTESSGA